MKKRSCRLILSAWCLCFMLFGACSYPFATHPAAMTQEVPATPLADYIYTALKEEEATIDLTAYATDEATVRQVYSTLYATEPSLFFISSEYALSEAPDGTVAYLRPDYRLCGSAREEAEAQLASAVSAITSPIAALTPLEQVAYLHDYTVTHFTYDSTYRVYDAYSLLVSGRGVCQAYALLFRALCDSLSLPCVCIPSFEMAHEWNAVMIGDEWYHIDLVWDDTDRPGEVLHTYFLIGDEEMRARRALQDTAWDTSYSWSCDFTSSGIRALSAPWRTCTTPFYLPGDGFIYYTTNREIWSTSPSLVSAPVNTE